jgi:hypothetical protein
MSTTCIKPHYRLRVGRLADGRRAFAVATRCISALGDYPVVSVWVNDPEDSHGLALLRDRPYVRKDSAEYQRLFAMILNGEERELTGCPLQIADELGWF